VYFFGGTVDVDVSDGSVAFAVWSAALARPLIAAGADGGASDVVTTSDEVPVIPAVELVGVSLGVGVPDVVTEVSEVVVVVELGASCASAAGVTAKVIATPASTAPARRPKGLFTTAPQYGNAQQKPANK
jgi:hypothetical protein